jgi:hypothetical protein
MSATFFCSFFFFFYFFIETELGPRNLLLTICLVFLVVYTPVVFFSYSSFCCGSPPKTVRTSVWWGSVRLLREAGTHGFTLFLLFRLLL